MSEVKTKALDTKLPEKLAEVKVETLVTLLSERKAEALMDTPVGLRSRHLRKNWPSWMQSVGRYTGRQKSTDEDADTWRDTG